MAKMSRSKVEEIVERELPDYRVVSPSRDAAVDSARRRQQPEASSPEIDHLMKKFHLDDDVDTDFTGNTVPNGGGAVDDEIVLVEKVNPADPLSRGNRPKAKVVSANGKIKGSQG